MPPQIVIPQSSCLPSISDYVGFLPRAHDQQSSYCERIETTVPSERGKWKHQKCTPQAKVNKQEGSEAAVGHLCSWQAMPKARWAAASVP